MAETPDVLGRITVLVGHYGSGKTEVAVNLAVRAAERLRELQGAKTPAAALPYDKVALCDLDIANPYFRSREKSGINNPPPKRMSRTMISSATCITDILKYCFPHLTHFFVKGCIPPPHILQ